MKVSKLKRLVPWWLKIVTKIVLSRLPASYDHWQRLDLFRHGNMDNVIYAFSVFDSHVKRAGLQGQLYGKTVLEFGPGDSIASAIIANGYGARAILVDVGNFAKKNVEDYAGLLQLLQTHGLNTPDTQSCNALEDLLAACGARYFTNGLQAFVKIDNASVDFIYSQAVLEHVRRYEFLPTQRECARVLKPNGICSHRVDLRDHLGGGLNNLRFSESVWESDLFVKSGFYTNRIQLHLMIEFFERAGFQAEVSEIRRWDQLPIKQGQLAADFQSLPIQMLNVSGFDVLLSHF
jgi:SAM-dependent methyltransferase